MQRQRKPLAHARGLPLSYVAPVGWALKHPSVHLMEREARTAAVSPAPASASRGLSPRTVGTAGHAKAVVSADSEPPQRWQRVRRRLVRWGAPAMLLLAGTAMSGSALAAVAKEVAVAAKPDLEELVLTKIIPTLGTFLSNALYFSFAPGVVKAIQAGSLGALNPIPVAMQFISTICWASYAMAIKNPFIAASNVPAVVLSMWAVASLLPLIKDSQQLKTFKNLLVGGTGAIIGLVTALFFAINPANHAFVLGSTATALCIVLFASPLTAMKEVIASKDSSSIYAPFAIVQTLNCLLWLLYGLKIWDVWVYGPNATGLGLAIIQLALLLIFPAKNSGTLAAKSA